MKESIWMTRECWWENRTLHENPHPVDRQERIFKAFLWLSVRKEVKKAWPLQIPRSISHLPICPLPSTCTNSWPLHVFVFSFIRTLTPILLSQQRKWWTLLSATSLKYGIALASCKICQEYIDWFYLESGSSEASLVFWQFWKLQQLTTRQDDSDFFTWRVVFEGPADSLSISQLSSSSSHTFDWLDSHEFCQLPYPPESKIVGVEDSKVWGWHFHDNSEVSFRLSKQPTGDAVGAPGMGGCFGNRWCQVFVFFATCRCQNGRTTWRHASRSLVTLW